MNLKVNLEKMRKMPIVLVKKGRYVAFSGIFAVTSLALTGCNAKELSNSMVVADDYDKISHLISGVVQELSVPGEDFKLVVEYNCMLEDDEEWTVTGNKNLFMKIYTKGLTDDKKVYIDNIHIDTTIMATVKEFDGILQDTMDDRIHNSVMIGFPISDSTYYYGVNTIEGQNDNFIQGVVYGYNGYKNGTVTQQRFLESDYLEKGVFANKITSVVGLLIQDQEHDEPYGVDVLSTLRVDFCNKVTFTKDGELFYKVFEVDDHGEIQVSEVKQGHTRVLNKQ